MFAEREEHLDQVFHALSNRTRRSLLLRLCEGSANISELAAPFSMTFAAVSKHITVLEEAGLVTRTVEGRVHRCALDPTPLGDAMAWLEAHRVFWGQNLDALASYFEDQKRQKGQDDADR